MFRLAFAGLDKLPEGVVSLEDYFSRFSSCYLTRSACLVCGLGWTSCWRGSPHWSITSASPLLVI
jgi:hypothetical protein